jgi:hypothetical protein
MRKIALVLLFGLLVSGCGLSNSLYIQYNPLCQTASTTAVGSPMVQAEEQCINDVYGGVYASFSQQLIYAGKIGNTIRITYREFSNQLARPAFSQELTYDLSGNNIIVFKQTKMEVKEASNSAITIIVLESPTCQKQPGSKIGNAGGICANFKNWQNYFGQ